MSLRSSARTIGAICGNDMLDRAEALVAEMRVPKRFWEDAVQVAVLADLEGEDPKRAVERWMRKEKTCGLTGDNTGMPRVIRSSLRVNADEGAEAALIQREEKRERATRAAKVVSGKVVSIHSSPASVR